MLSHIEGIHSWKDNKLIHKYEHGQLNQEQKGLKTNSPSFLALKNGLENKKIVADINYLSKFFVMGNLKVFHSVVNKYCPKRLHFTLEGMIARTQLAVLDYNCGSNNTQATAKDGKKRYKQIFSKVAQNWAVKKISKAKGRKYIHKILSSTLEASRDTAVDKLPRICLIPPNIAPIEQADKEETIENMKT